MAIENAWTPILTCESCDEITEADFILPQTGGTAKLVCWSHATDWYDSESSYLRFAARKLHEVHSKDMDHITESGIN